MGSGGPLLTAETSRSCGYKTTGSGIRKPDDCGDARETADTKDPGFVLEDSQMIRLVAVSIGAARWKWKNRRSAGYWASV
jgi:hypothetical protein